VTDAAGYCFQQESLELGLPPEQSVPTLAWPGPGERLTRELPLSGLAGFTTGLFVQARASEAADVRRLVQHTGVGAVFTVERRKGPRLHQALRAVDHMRRLASSDNVLIDQGLYSGRRRKLARDGLTKDCVREQLQVLKLPWALTDSGYIATLDDVDLVLNAAARLNGRVVVALPMDYRVLRDHASEIAARVNGQSHPVAVMLEHANDPVDARGVVEGLTHVIANTVHPVLLLRSDTSVLGALAHGAAVGAVGTHSGLRHIYPAKEGGGRPEQLAFVIPELLGYFAQPRFARAYLRDPRHTAWECSCWFCTGRQLTWVGNQAESLMFRGAFQHSVAAVGQMGALLQSGVPGLDTAQVWSAMCAGARARHEAIANPSGSTWKPKAALSHWASLTPALTRT
jgi:hypothetical protein